MIVVKSECRWRGARRLSGLSLALVVLVAIAEGNCGAADWRLAQEEFLSGHYSNCIAQARHALSEEADNEDWQIVLSRALLMTGQYREALKAITNALAMDRSSLRLCWQAREVLLCNGQVGPANEMVSTIVRQVSRRPADFADASGLIVFGQALLLAGQDPKRVLDMLIDPAKKAMPKAREVYLVGGRLALEKHDFALAARRFQEGLKQLPDDPDLQCGLARAYASSDRALMVTALDAALERNSNHVESLLVLADQSVDAEAYATAIKFLDRIQKVNPWHPEAWAYRSVIAHLQNKPEEEKTARQTALKFWPTNPLVDHLIGRKLSQDYRFSEGASHERQALNYEPDYLPAKAQLSQDLLRLGEEAEGWELAEEVQKKDGYDVQAYNLTMLRDTMAKFVTLTNRDFVLRMGAHQAALFGPRVLDLLDQAKSNLCAKYELQLANPTIVEVFPEQKDFAVRTFGMPGNPGYLGVCFGNVITANGPVAHSTHPVNWQAVLWHEFCHVVTLHLTRNKMPRWLSEGISVYEEGLANPAWGQRMDPQYRELVLGDDLTPISQLSGAFLSPPTEMHLQFAYYESSLVVEFLIQRFGLAKLKAVLRALGEGGEINQVLEKHTTAMATLESDFETFAKERARALGPGLEWEKPQETQVVATGRRTRRPRPLSVPVTRTNTPRSAVVVTNAPLNPLAATNQPPTRLDTIETNLEHTEVVEVKKMSWEEWAKNRPTNFYVMARQAQKLVEAKEWQEAQPVLKRLIEHYPDFTGSDSAYRLLAASHRALRETNAEREVLGRFAERDAKAPDAYGRLMELGAAAGDWAAVRLNAERYLAVDPLVAPPYRMLAQASEEKGKGPQAIAAYRSLLALEPPDPADVHFRLARALQAAGQPEARRQVLQALEEAPRYQPALQLLLEINRQSPRAARPDSPASPPK